MTGTYRPVPLEFTRRSRSDQIARAAAFASVMRTRRTVRDFAPDPVPEEVLDAAIAVAASAPSGANMQPWRFVVVRDPAVKRRIREAAEAEERESYERRMPDEWLDALAPLGTDWQKPFLEVAPVLLVIFRIDYRVVTEPDGQTRRVKHYYVSESVGIAAGMLLAALHWAGLATITHTPSPMGFLSDILDRPVNEKPYLLVPVGYPAAGAAVPVIERKALSEVRLDV
ncbi:MAG TPA: nitroreductase family protein [Vicinamibacterales bacterium]|nr:nitroreductase family protein [Vicinamibacterales bacterium]